MFVRITILLRHFLLFSKTIARYFGHWYSVSGSRHQHSIASNHPLPSRPYGSGQCRGGNARRPACCLSLKRPDAASLGPGERKGDNHFHRRKWHVGLRCHFRREDDYYRRRIRPSAFPAARLQSAIQRSSSCSLRSKVHLQLIPEFYLQFVSGVWR